MPVKFTPSKVTSPAPTLVSRTEDPESGARDDGDADDDAAGAKPKPTKREVEHDGALLQLELAGRAARARARAARPGDRERLLPPTMDASDDAVAEPAPEAEAELSVKLPLADRDAASQPPVMEVVAAAVPEVPPEVVPEAAQASPETQPPEAVPFVDL